MRALRIAAFAIAACLTAYDAAAVRFELRVVDQDGAVVDGAEICIFPAPGDTPVEQWLGSDDLRCFPATTILAFPPGRWNVLARLEGRSASRHPFVIPVRDDPANTDTGYRRLEISLTAGAVLTLTRPAAGSALAFYFPGTADTLPFAVPVARGEERVTLPAGLSFVPFVMEQGRVARIGKPRPALAAGSRLAFAMDADDAIPTVLSYARAARIAEELTGAPPWELPAPRLRLTAADGRQHEPSTAFTPRDGELVMFRGVAAGPATLSAVGATWEDSDTSFKIVSGAPVTLAPPLPLAPAAAVEIRSSLETEQWLTARAAPECRNKEFRARPVTVDVSRCDGEQCVVQRSSPLETLLAQGQVELDRLPVGRYTVRVVSGERVLVRSEVVARSGWQRATVEAGLGQVHGRVTRAGAPVQARLSIGDGTAVTDGDGSYTLFFRNAHAPDRVEVRDCATAAQFVLFPAAEIRAPATYDVELPASTEISVVDRATSKPVPRAEVRITVPDRTTPGVLLLNESMPPTDAGGRTRATTTPLGPFAVCASAEEYEPACVDGGSGPVTVALAPSPSHAGSVTGVTLRQPALLFFVAAGGAVTEMVRVGTDGTFRYRAPRQPDGYAVFVSATHPLVALRVPERTPLVVSIPAVQARTVTVRAGGERSFEVGVVLGGLRIPSAALARHQGFRGLPPFTTGGQLVLPDLGALGPIEIYRGFAIDGRPPMLPPQADAFVLPEYRDRFPRQVARTAEVVFPD